MKFTREMVDKYAKDLLIGLTAEENKMVLDEFEIIDENMEKINQIADISEETAMTHPLEDYEIVLREDEVTEELSLEEVLQNAKNTTDEEIVVPKVVE
jgi:aspartyl/glutamyl-tRNA(Asn/Gln) amidotransferase C subunit